MNEPTEHRLIYASNRGFGKYTRMYSSCLVLGDVKVGENVWIGPWTILDGSGGLEIGSNCSISAGVHIYTHDSMEWALSGGHADYPQAPVKIGDNCYIGPHAVICKGVTIGKGCVIGANSVVMHNVIAGSVVVGSPAKETQASLCKRAAATAKELGMREQLELMR